VLSSVYPVAAGRRGTIQFTRLLQSDISVIGVRFTSLGALSTIPAVAQ